MNKWGFLKNIINIHNFFESGGSCGTGCGGGESGLSPATVKTYIPPSSPPPMPAPAAPATKIVVVCPNGNPPPCP